MSNEESKNHSLNGQNGTEASSLLPCPFCGGVAAMRMDRETVNGRTKTDFSVRCHDSLYICGCAPCTTTYKTEEAAVAAWNRRAVMTAR